MPIRIICPSCKAVNNIDDEKRGRKVRCRKCDQPISDAPAKSKRAEEQAVQSKPKVKLKPAARPDDEDEVDERSAKKPAKKGFPVLLAVGGGTTGDRIGQGKNYEYAGAQLMVKRTMRGFHISVDGWNVDIGAPQGQFLQVGEYPNAKRFAFSGPSPGLEFSGKGRGSNRIAGEFVVWELEMNGDQVVRLAIDFVQRSEEKMPPLSGKLRVNSSFQ